MKFFASAALAVLAAVVRADVAFTNSNYNVVAGEPFTLTWSGAAGPVNITLEDGSTSNLQAVEVIDSDDSNTSFTWTPPASLPSDSYVFAISDGTTTNYSPQFTFVGSASASSSVASSTAASSTAASTHTSAHSSSASHSSAVSSHSTLITSTTANSTTTASKSHSASATSTKTSASSSSSASATTVPNTSDGQRFSSPLAMVLVAVAGLLYFN